MSEIKTVCKKCGATDQKGYIGTSRRDNTTTVCPSCEQQEAFSEWNEKCTLCGINWVDVQNGYDTCEECLSKQ